ncbi:hypothetical protein GCM10022235_14230 [Kribbella ginsengisoli]|uniref:Uncharacterized protein n=1 Tax=Kribbella ginsengisoli TaxID=363865 RepID=A0ABP6WA79_9ACTN
MVTRLQFGLDDQYYAVRASLTGVQQQLTHGRRDRLGEHSADHDPEDARVTFPLHSRAAMRNTIDDHLSPTRRPVPQQPRTLPDECCSGSHPAGP